MEAELLNTIIMIFKYGWWLIILFILWFEKKRYSNYPIEAVIIEKRGDNHIKTNDRVGKYVDKMTGLVGYKFMKSKDTIPVVNYEWIMHNNQQEQGLFDKIYNKLAKTSGTAFFYKYGSKQYKPIKITNDANSKIEWEEIKNKNGEPVIVSIIKPIDIKEGLVGLNFEVIDWDNMNFMVQEQRASIERRRKTSEMWKQIIIPALIIGGAVVVAIVMLKLGYDFALAMKNTAIGQSAGDFNSTNANIPIIKDLLPK